MSRAIKMTKRLIILDLDETLVHTSNSHIIGDPGIHKLTIREGDTFLTSLRPDALTFIVYAFREFDNVAIWSAGTRDYVDTVVDLLMPREVRNRLLFVWSRDECETIDKFHYKNLNKVVEFCKSQGITININQMVIVDDNKEFQRLAKMNNIRSVYPIEPYREILCEDFDQDRFLHIASRDLKNDHSTEPASLYFHSYEL
jgi:hypothetical protein